MGAVICDYLDLLCPSKRVDMSNLFVKDKYVSEELRALAFEFGISVVTASQLTVLAMSGRLGQKVRRLSGAVINMP